MAKKTETELDQGKQLELIIGGLEKSLGKGIVVWGEHTNFPNIDRISSGSFSLDYALNGGYAKGRIVEIFGPFSSGKTTLALHMIAECQKAGGMCLFVDIEHALDIHYATALGVNINQLLVSQPDSGEDALNVVEAFVRSNAVNLIVIDSVAALVPKAEIEGNIGDSRPGAQARLMSQALRIIAGPTKKNNITVLFLNQIRHKIGVSFGPTETTSGGEALKFYASQRLDIRRTGYVKLGEEVTGINTRVKIIKNKVGPPFRQSEFNILFGKGIDAVTDLANMAVNKEVIKRAGAWYSHGDEKVGQGINSVIDRINIDSQFAQTIKEQIIEACGGNINHSVDNDQAIIIPE